MKPEEFRAAWVRAFSGEEEEFAEFAEETVEEEFAEEEFAEFSEETAEEEFAEEELATEGFTVGDSVTPGSVVNVPMEAQEPCVYGIRSVTVKARESCVSPDVLLEDWLLLHRRHPDYVASWNERFHTAYQNKYELFHVMLQVKYHIFVDYEAVEKFYSQLTSDVLERLACPPHSLSVSDFEALLNTDVSVDEIYSKTACKGDVRSILGLEEEQSEQKPVEQSEQKPVEQPAEPSTGAVDAFTEKDASCVSELAAFLKERQYPKFIYDLYNEGAFDESLIEKSSDAFVLLILSDVKKYVGIMNDKIAAVMDSEEIYTGVCLLLKAVYLDGMSKEDYALILGAVLFYTTDLLMAIEKFNGVQSYNSLVAKYVLLRCGVQEVSTVMPEIGNTVFVFEETQLTRYSLDAALLHPEILLGSFSGVHPTGLSFGTVVDPKLLEWRGSVYTDMYVWIHNQKVAKPEGFNLRVLSDNLRADNVTLSEPASGFLSSLDTVALCKFERDFGLLATSHKSFATIFASDNFLLYFKLLHKLLMDEPVGWTVYKFLFYLFNTTLKGRLVCETYDLNKLKCELDVVSILGIGINGLVTYRSMLGSLEQITEQLCKYDKVCLTIGEDGIICVRAF